MARVRAGPAPFSAMAAPRPHPAPPPCCRLAPVCRLVDQKLVQVAVRGHVRGVLGDWRPRPNGSARGGVRSGARGAGVGCERIRADCGRQRTGSARRRPARWGRAMGPCIIAGGRGGEAETAPRARGGRDDAGHKPETNAHHKAHPTAANSTETSLQALASTRRGVQEPHWPLIRSVRGVFGVRRVCLQVEQAIVVFDTTNLRHG